MIDLFNMNRHHRSPQQFASSWLLFKRSTAGSHQWNSNEWVVGAEVDWASQRPHDLFSAIVNLSNQEMSDREIGLLGAGPVETLLASQYGVFAKRVFRIAETSEVMQMALKFVDVNDENETDFDCRLAHLKRKQS